MISKNGTQRLQSRVFRQAIVIPHEYAVLSGSQSDGGTEVPVITAVLFLPAIHKRNLRFPKELLQLFASAIPRAVIRDTDFKILTGLQLQSPACFNEK